MMLELAKAYPEYRDNAARGASEVRDVSPAEVRASIDRKIEDIRRRIARQGLDHVQARNFERGQALAPFGRLVVYGMASREAATPIAPSSLMTGSLSVVGFWLVDCMKVDPIGMVAQPLADLVRLVASGEVTPLPGTAYPLEDARRAHEDMRGRRTTGKVILTAR